MHAESISLDNNGAFFAAETAALDTSVAIDTEIVEGGVDAIRSLAGEWAELCAENGDDQPFSRPEWFEAFVTVYETRVKLLTARRGGKLVAVLPLVVGRGSLHGVPVKTLGAVFNLQTQRFDLVHTNDRSLRRPIADALWRAIRSVSGWTMLELRLVPADSWLNDVVEAAARDGFATGVWEMDAAPFVGLPANDDRDAAVSEFAAGLKAHFRHELKRRLKRLNETGEVRFDRTAGYSSDLMDRYLELERRSWKGEAGTAAACDPRKAQLHHEFARRVSERGAIEFYELTLDGEPIAISILLRFGTKTIFWKTSFDESRARFSPGNLLIKHFTDNAIRAGSDEIDMLSPATDYKKAWATGERRHVAFYAFRPGIAGRALSVWKFGAIAYLRRFKTPQGGRK